MRYRRGEHPRSLANLKPIRPGQVLNPEGINQRKRELEAWRIAVALCDAVDAAPTEERAAELLEQLARHCLDQAIVGDTAVTLALLNRLWPID